MKNCFQQIDNMSQTYDYYKHFKFNSNAHNMTKNVLKIINVFIECVYAIYYVLRCTRRILFLFSDPLQINLCYICCYYLHIYL